MPDLFSNSEPTLITGLMPGVMGRGWSADEPVQVAVWLCTVCGSMVGNRQTHAAWHTNPGGTDA